MALVRYRRARPEGVEVNAPRDALAEAMFKAGYSEPNSDAVDIEWAKRGLYETGYRASIVLGLLRDLGFDVAAVDA